MTTTAASSISKLSTNKWWDESVPYAALDTSKDDSSSAPTLSASVANGPIVVLSPSKGWLQVWADCLLLEGSKGKLYRVAEKAKAIFAQSVAWLVKTYNKFFGFQTPFQGIAAQSPLLAPASFPGLSHLPGVNLGVDIVVAQMPALHLQHPELNGSQLASLALESNLPPAQSVGAIDNLLASVAINQFMSPAALGAAYALQYGFPKSEKDSLSSTTESNLDASAAAHMALEVAGLSLAGDLVQPFSPLLGGLFKAAAIGSLIHGMSGYSTLVERLHKTYLRLSPASQAEMQAIRALVLQAPKDQEKSYEKLSSSKASLLDLKEITQAAALQHPIFGKGYQLSHFYSEADAKKITYAAMSALGVACLAAKFASGQSFVTQLTLGSTLGAAAFYARYAKPKETLAFEVAAYQKLSEFTATQMPLLYSTASPQEIINYQTIAHAAAWGLGLFLPAATQPYIKSSSVLGPLLMTNLGSMQQLMLAKSKSQRVQLISKCALTVLMQGSLFLGSKALTSYALQQDDACLLALGLTSLSGPYAKKVANFVVTAFHAKWQEVNLLTTSIIKSDSMNPSLLVGEDTAFTTGGICAATVAPITLDLLARASHFFLPSTQSLPLLAIGVTTSALLAGTLQTLPIVASKWQKGNKIEAGATVALATAAKIATLWATKTAMEALGYSTPLAFEAGSVITYAFSGTITRTTNQLVSLVATLLQSR